MSEINQETNSMFSKLKLGGTTSFKRFLIALIGTLILLLACSFVFRRFILIAIVSCVFTYLFYPVSSFLERKYRFSPRASALTIICFFVLIAVVCISIIIPILITQVQTILELLPKAKLYYHEHLEQFVTKVISLLNLNFSSDIDSLKEKLLSMDIMSNFDVISGIFSQFYQKTSSILNFAIDLCILPLICYLILKNCSSLSNKFLTLIPEDVRGSYLNIYKRVDSSLKSVIRGQVIIALILGVLYTIGFLISGLPFAITIGIICGICRLIPYADIIVGCILSAIVLIACPVTSWTVIGVVATFIIVPTIDGLVCVPKIMGNKIGVHPILIFISVIAFGYNWGVWGVILTIPVLAVAKTLISMLIDYYYKQDWYQNKPSTK